MALTPKETFLKQRKDLGEIRDLLHGHKFLDAAQTALLQFLVENRTEDSAAAWNQTTGARRFLEILMHVADETKPIVGAEPENQLNYERMRKIHNAR